VARDKHSDNLLAAVWAVPEVFSFLKKQERYCSKDIFEIRNIFTVPESRGHGVGAAVLSAIVNELMANRTCHFIHSMVLEHRIASSRMHLKTGFSIIGTMFQWNILEHWFTRFRPVCNHLRLSSFDKIPAVVIAQEGSNPLGIVRALGRNGISVFLVASDNGTFTRRSRYVKDGIYHVCLTDPQKLQTALQTLLQQINQPAVKPVLIVTNETHYRNLLPIADFVKENFIELMPMKQIVPYAEKEQQFPLAQQAGFLIVKTAILQSANDIGTASDFCFPVIVKPRAIHSRGKFHEKALIFKNINDLRTKISPILEEPNVELMLQEYIPGDDSQVIWFMASCGEKGEPRAWITGRKWRQYPPGRGVMASGVLEELPDFAHLSKQLCRLFGFRGFIGVECKQHSETQELFYIESSFRTEAYNSVCFAAGKNLVLDAYLAALGKPCPLIQTDSSNGSWCDASLDLDASRILIAEGKMSWRDYFKRLPRPIAWSCFAWDDPLPFFRWLPKRFKLILCAIFRLRF
jgi:predicted ATP-grasp superfamily ATP-dependent carboligase